MVVNGLQALTQLLSGAGVYHDDIIWVGSSLKPGYAMWSDIVRVFDCDYEMIRFVDKAKWLYFVTKSRWYECDVRGLEGLYLKSHFRPALINREHNSEIF